MIFKMKYFTKLWGDHQSENTMIFNPFVLSVFKSVRKPLSNNSETCYIIYLFIFVKLIVCFFNEYRMPQTVVVIFLSIT